METGCYGLLVKYWSIQGNKRVGSRGNALTQNSLSFHSGISARMSSILAEVFHDLISPSE